MINPESSYLFWNEYAKRPLIPVVLMKDYVKVGAYEQMLYSFEIDPETKDGVTSLCNGDEMSRFVFFMSCYSALLYIYTKQLEFQLVSPCFDAGNTSDYLLYGSKINADDTFYDLLMRNTECVETYQDLEPTDLDAIIDKHEIDRRLFNAGIGLNAVHNAANCIKIPGKFLQDLFLLIQSGDVVDTCTIFYNAALFKGETIAVFGRHFQTVVRHVLHNVHQKLDSLYVGDEPEISLITQTFCVGPVCERDDATILDFWARQVELQPHGIAVESGAHSYNYTQLNAWANGLADQLSQLGVGRNSIVGVLLDRSIEMIVSLLAVVKAGGAYMPIHPELPDERIRYMIEDSRTDLILTQSEYSTRIPRDVSFIDVTSHWNVGQQCEDDPATVLDGEGIAYLIYTSGTTGRPKGSIISHKAMINRLLWMQEQYPISRDDRILQKTSISFDVSVWELFWWMIAGARLVLLEHNMQKDPDNIMQCIREHQVTVLHFVPSMFHAFLSYAHQAPRAKDSLGTLKYIFASGEALKPEHVDMYYGLGIGAQLVNLYGPTEATVDVTYYTCSPDKNDEPVPIGKPITNLEIHILDAMMRPCPINVAGELYIAGAGLSEGYLNKPELTARFFISAPSGLRSTEHRRFYKTNDIARWKPDGNIEFLGRLDSQVKIRGYRIELGEIEKAILQVEGIESAICWFHEQESALYAFVTGKGALDLKAIRSYLHAQVPSYAVPHHIRQIDQLPLTINGKLDTRMILAKMVEKGGSDSFFEEDNRLFADIFKSELNLEHINGADNFFSLGGDSLKAIFITSRLLKLGYQLNIEDIFNRPTIRDIVQSIQATGIQHAETVMGVIPLTPPQIQFFHRRLSDSHYYNQGVLLHKRGSFQSGLLHQALTELLKTHDMLRCVFIENDKGEFVPTIRGVGEVVPHFTELYVDDNNQLQRIILTNNQKVQESFDLSSLLFAGILYKTQRGDHFYLVIHHLLVDSISWNIILDDLSCIYQALEEKEQLPILNKSSSYKSWGEYLTELSTSGTITDHEEYWLSVAEKGKDCFCIKSDKQSVMGSISQHTVIFDEAATASVSRLAGSHSIDMHALVLASIGIVLKRLTGCGNFLFELDKNGRDTLGHAIQLTRTVGWFNNLFPIVMSVDEEDCIALALQLKEDLARVPNNGMSYSILKYMNYKPNPLLLACKPQLFFNFVGETFSKNNDYVFELSHYNAGSSISPLSERAYSIDIVGSIERGSLKVTWDFDTNLFTETFIGSALEQFKQVIASLPHCIAANSEFANVTEQDYESILDMINDL